MEKKSFIQGIFATKLTVTYVIIYLRRNLLKYVVVAARKLNSRCFMESNMFKLYEKYSWLQLSDRPQQ